MSQDTFEPFVAMIEIEACSKDVELRYHQAIWNELCNRVMDQTGGELRAKVNLVGTRKRVPPFAGKPRKCFDFLIAPAQAAPSFREVLH